MPFARPGLGLLALAFVVVFVDPQRAGDVGIDLAGAGRRFRTPTRRLPERAQRRCRIAAAIGGLRSLGESVRRLARRVRGGKIAPTIARVIGRRLQAGRRREFGLLRTLVRGRVGEGGILRLGSQSGLRTDARRSAPDPGIEQLRERRRDRRQVRPRRLRACRLRRILFRLCRSGRRLRHRRKYGDNHVAWEGRQRAIDASAMPSANASTLSQSVYSTTAVGSVGPPVISMMKRMMCLSKKP